MKILRVGTRPTIQRPGMGIACYELCLMEEFDTLIFSYKLDRNDDYLTIENSNCECRLIRFRNPELPKVRTGMRFIWLQIVRILAIAEFNLIFAFSARNEYPEIVHIHSPLHFFVFGGDLEKLLKTPLSGFRSLCASVVFQPQQWYFRCCNFHLLAE